MTVYEHFITKVANWLGQTGIEACAASNSSSVIPIFGHLIAGGQHVTIQNRTHITMNDVQNVRIRASF